MVSVRQRRRRPIKDKDRVLDLKRTFRPEFLNRIDEIIVFHQLEEEHLQEIVDLMLKDVKKRLAEKGVTLEVSGEAKKLLTREGYDPTLGARPLRRTIQRLVENPLAEEILAGRIVPGDVVQVGVTEGELAFSTKERAIRGQHKNKRKSFGEGNMAKSRTVFVCQECGRPQVVGAAVARQLEQHGEESVGLGRPASGPPGHPAE